MNQVEARVTIQQAEDLRRLALKAERSGVRILRIDGTDRHVATSATQPVCYAVSVAGCSCKGFLAWQRCTHHSLLLAELGRIPDVDPDVAVEAHPAPYRCGGEGFVKSYVGGGLGDWVAVPCSCIRHAA
ncbi:MAG: hypothetical protein M3R02_11730 [Chloroflexota bacterium]|nr:hypothetical protein [Chloroflexota bacterium]